MLPDAADTHGESESIDVQGGKIEVVPVWQWLLR